MKFTGLVLSILALGAAQGALNDVSLQQKNSNGEFKEVIVPGIPLRAVGFDANGKLVPIAVSGSFSIASKTVPFRAAAGSGSPDAALAFGPNFATTGNTLSLAGTIAVEVLPVATTFLGPTIESSEITSVAGSKITATVPVESLPISIAYQDHNNVFSAPNTFDARLILGGVATPATVADGKLAFYTKGDGILYTKTPAGTESVVMTGTGGSGPLTDGNKGDVIVSGSGAVFTIANSAVTLPKMANLAQGKLLGRSDSAAGPPQPIQVNPLDFGMSGSLLVLQPVPDGLDPQITDWSDAIFTPNATFIGSIITNSTTPGGIGTGSIVAQGGIYVAQNLILDSDIASSTTQSGGFVINGSTAANSIGMGGGKINAGSDMSVGGTLLVNSLAAFMNDVSVTGTLSAANLTAANVTGTTRVASTSTADAGIGTGAIVASAGGIYALKGIWADGPMIIGGGDPIKNVLTGSSAIDFDVMVAGSENTKTVSVVGVLATNLPSISLGWSAALPDGIVVKQAWVSSAGTVSIRVRNTSASTIDPGGLSVRATVTSF